MTEIQPATDEEIARMLNDIEAGRITERANTLSLISRIRAETAKNSGEIEAGSGCLCKDLELERGSLAIPANSRAEAIGTHAKELLEHFQLVPMSAQQRKVYNNLRVLLRQEGE